MLESNDAAVLIGDPALVAAQNPGEVRVYDMAALWHKFTGKSFVFAAWVARNGLDDRAELETLLQDARDQGVTQVAQIVAANPLHTSLPDAVVASYLTEAIEYRLTPAHRAGLEEFGQRVRAL